MDLQLRALESPDNFKNLIGKITSKYNIDPNNEQNIINIKSYLRTLNGKLLLNVYKTAPAVNDIIISRFGEYINEKSSIPDGLEATRNYLLNIIKLPGDDEKNADITNTNKFTVERLTQQSLQKNKTNYDSNLSDFINADNQTKIDIVKYLNYESLFRDEYIIADSRYQNTTNSDRSKIVFSLQTNLRSTAIDTTNIQSQGGIIVSTNIKDIVQIEVSPFTIPYNPTFLNFYNKISLTINEWTANSYQAFEGGQFHFMFDILKTENNLIYLNPVDRIFRFNKPVNYIDNFTLSFGAMLPKIKFDIDRMSASKFDYKSKDGIITFDQPHNLITGDLIYISDFTTPDPALDVEFINDMNRSSGHTIVKKNNYSICTNMDFSLIRHETPAGSLIYPIDSFNQSINVYFASKRIQIQLRIRHLIQAVPN